jgi:transposase
MRAIARRWLALHEEIRGLEQELEHMVLDKAPELMEAHGISTMTVAERLILVGDNPERINSEAALAKMCGVCPIPLPAARQTACVSIEAATGKPMLHSIASPSSACGTTNTPKPTQHEEPQKAKPSVRSYAVSSDISSEKSTALYVRRRKRQPALHRYRSIRGGDIGKRRLTTLWG